MAANVDFSIINLGGKNKETHDEPREHVKIYSTIILALCSFTFGMNLSYFNSLEIVFRGNEAKKIMGLFVMSKLQWSMAVTLLFPSALLANICASYIKINGKFLLLASNIFYIKGHMMLLFARSPLFVIIGRVIIGLASGITCAVVPLYLQKFSTQKTKGIYGSLHQLSLCSGIFSATIFSFIFCNEKMWKAGMVGLISFIAINFFLLMFIHKFDDTTTTTSNSVFSLLTSKVARKSLIASVILHAGQQLSGIRAVIIFSNTIFQTSPNPKLCCALIGFNLILGTLISMMIVDRFGRKKMLCVSLLIAGLSLLVLAFQIHDIIGIFGFILGYSLGMGPIPWFIIGEIFPEDYKRAGTMIGVSANWLFTYIVAVCFYFVFDHLGYRSFFMFFGAICLILIYVVFQMKETKGKSSDFMK